MKEHEIAVCGVPFDTAEEKEALRKLKEHGATSVQIYVHWCKVEPEKRGEFDWSYYDRQVKLIQDAGRKWVVFLIVGPAYSTPEWFKKEGGPCGMVCLEHGVAGEIESIWNPLWRQEVTRLLEAFAAHYVPWNVIESVQPGISGDYGEAIYPAIGSHPGVYHTHYGYWCMDKYALASFRRTLQEKYGDIAALNKAWRAFYKDFEEIVPFKRHKAPSRTAQFDFMMWYKASMTDYDEFWMRECQRIFKGIPVYMCTGGDEEPYLGADFAEQARASAKYGGGIRLTNEGNDFYENYDDTVHCVTSCKYYGAYMGLEPVGPMKPYGVTARTFGSAAYGNRQIFHYYGNLFDSGDAGAKRMQKYLDIIGERETKENVAVFLPLDMTWLEGSEVPGNIRQALNFVRRQYETAVISETLVEDGILDGIKVLIMLGVKYTRAGVLKKIAEWVKNGGTLITDERCTDIEGEFVAEFDEALGFTSDSLYYGGITDFKPTVPPWGREFCEKDGCCNKIGWGRLSPDAKSLLTTIPRPSYTDKAEVDYLSCAFYRGYGKGMGVYYCAPLDLTPRTDPLFGEYHIYEHILSDLLREFASVSALGTKADEIARARFDGKMMVLKHDEISFIDEE
ncbi:MAG: family 14 glycosylhydrolase [Clostridia bacterium]|nr:family 14 glycosylhydrolase [Clostridia bacterium]